MYDITSSICETFCPLYFWHSTHYVWQHNTLCWLHHNRRMYDIVCATEAVTSTLSQQATIFMTSHPLQAWHHTTCIRHGTNCVFVIRASLLISHPLLYDITPTISVTSYALYITSYPLLMLSHYCTYDSTILTYETTSSIQFKIYTIPVTSQSLVCVITPTLLRASHTLFVWHHTRHRYSIFCTIEDIASSFYEIKPQFLWHHTHYIWHCIDAISVITSSVLMISPNSIYEISFSIYVNIISIVYNSIFTIFVPSQPLYLCLTPTLSMISHPLYIWHCTYHMFNIRNTI